MALDRDRFSSELRRVFDLNGLGKLLNYEKTGRLTALAEFLLAENEKYNLTALTDPDAIILLHFADSAAIASLIPKGSRLLDVGCGAGFPSLVLATCREDLSVTALDATEKKIGFVRAAAERLSLSNLTAEVLRAEDGARVGDPMREAFPFVTARAVARLRVLAELCLPFVSVGGTFLAMKGQSAESELSEAKRAIALLGGKSAGASAHPLTNGRDEPVAHTTLLVKKVAHTPALYPRPYAQISKKPL